MYPLIIYPLAPSDCLLKDWYLLVLDVYLRSHPSTKKGTLIRTSCQPVQLPTSHMTRRHDEVIPIEVLKPLFGPDHRRPVVERLSIRIRDTLFCPRLLRLKISLTVTVEQRVVYSIYYNGTLVLPWRGERGVALAGDVWVRVE